MNALKSGYTLEVYNAFDLPRQVEPTLIGVEYTRDASGINVNSDFVLQFLTYYQISLAEGNMLLEVESGYVNSWEDRLVLYGNLNLLSENVKIPMKIYFSGHELALGPVSSMQVLLYPVEKSVSFLALLNAVLYDPDILDSVPAPKGLGSFKMMPVTNATLLIDPQKNLVLGMYMLSSLGFDVSIMPSIYVRDAGVSVYVSGRTQVAVDLFGYETLGDTPYFISERKELDDLNYKIHMKPVNVEDGILLSEVKTLILPTLSFTVEDLFPSDETSTQVLASLGVTKVNGVIEEYFIQRQEIEMQYLPDLLDIVVGTHTLILEDDCFVRIMIANVDGNVLANTHFQM